MFRQMLGAIDGTMLPSGTTEGYLQMSKIALYKSLHMMVNELIHGVQEGQYLAVLLEKVNDRLIQTRQLLVLVILTRVMG